MIRVLGIALAIVAATCVTNVRAQDFGATPTPIPMPSGPLVTLTLEIENAQLRVGEFIALRVRAQNETPHGLIGFVPGTTIRVATWPSGWRDVSIVDDDFIGSGITLLPAGNRYVWGSADKWWSAHALQVTWAPGDYRLRYCTPIYGRLVCSNTVELNVSEYH